MGKKLLFITAHPDDECYLAAGTMLANQSAKGKNYVICATLGEKGKHHYSKKISESNLKKIRKKELLRVSRLIKIHKLFILNMSDGRLISQIATLTNKVKNITKKLNPDFIISFGPDGITGHLDHLACFRVATIITIKLGIPFIKFSLPPSVIPNAKKHLHLRRKNSQYTSNFEYTFPNIKIIVSPRLKLKALQMHASQHKNNDPFYTFPKHQAKELLRGEYFVA